MLDQILSYFPAYTHPLTLVHDPDDLLADESLLAALAERGFTLLQETDPITLRHRMQALRPFRLERPVIVATAGALNELPYDLWQVRWALALATDIKNVSLGTFAGMLRVSPLGVPPVAAMQNTLGQSLMGLGDSKLAVEVFEKAVKCAALRLA
jgi:hypothetical protein